MPYYVYVIQCDDGSFYTGYSKNLDKRVKLHTNGKGARYLKIHKPLRVVHVEEFDSRAEAMRRERKIKLLSHVQKLKLKKSRLRSRRHTTQIRTNKKKAKKNTVV
ncbi:MAG TPA: GIY-YIG nuclease family protein [Candidatus Bathyarchaeia archaeon]|nr:GIY-YIG nuclease family protein [Candidatus Bathyarchaeia archaeon]